MFIPVTITSLLAADISGKLSDFVKSPSTPLSPEIAAIFDFDAPFSSSDIGLSSPTVLMQQLLVAADAALHLGKLDVSARLLSLAECCGEDRHCLRSRRELLELLRTGKQSNSKTVHEIVDKNLKQFSSLVKHACIVHRLVKLAAVFRSLSVADAISRLQVRSLQEIVDAVNWSQHTQGVPTIEAELSGDWLRLLSIK